MKPKNLYKATSFFSFVFSVLLKMALIALMVFCVYMYNENPAVFIFIGIIALATFMLSGEEEIIIYEDKVEQKTNSIISILLKG